MSFQNCPVPCGLIFYLKDSPVPVPLRKVGVKTKVVDFVARVTVEQNYVNQESTAIEVVYMFPVEEEAAVVQFSAEVDGRIIKTDVKKKSGAREDYRKALQDNKTAVLLEETLPDIFRIKVGQLKPGAGAKISLTYISELPVEGKSVRLTVPTTIAPRYTPPSDDSEAAKIISGIPYSLSSPAPLYFDLCILSQSKLISIKSPSHEITTKISSEQKEDGKYSAKVELKGQTTDLDRDVVVLIENSVPQHATVFVEKTEDPLVAAMVSLVPSFRLKNQKTELIFLVDRSGSMGGSSIEAAKKALELFLHSLPVDCYFNIVSFGSHFSFLFETSKKYDDVSLVEAKSHVASMMANFGGTEIFQPLDAIFKQAPQEGYLRQVFVLTDGEVSNSMSIINLVKKNSSRGRVFALGIGASASRHLVKGISRAGGGTSVFATVNEDLRPKVMSQLKNALQPCISDIKLEWEGIHDPPESVEVETTKTLLGYQVVKKSTSKKLLSIGGQAPRNLAPIYDGTRLLVYRLFADQNQDLPKYVKITAVTPDGPLSVELPIDKSCYLDGDFVHQLAARKRIQDLEEMILDETGFTEEDVENAVVELAMKYRLASKYTSFVGVDDREAKGDFEPAMITRVIKSQVPSGFGFGQFQFSSAQSNAMPMLFQKPMDVPMGAFPSTCAPGFAAQESLGGGGVRFDSCRSAAPQMKMKCKGGGNLFSKKLSTPQQLVSHDDDELDASSSPDDDLTRIINLQSSDGHFIWGDVLTSSTGKGRDELMSKKPDFVENEDIWITALVIVVLEKLVHEKPLWELVVDKSRKFLLLHLKRDEEVDKLIAEANKLI